MQVISVSRRTDIPAFHAEWLMARLRAGEAVYRNPFGASRHVVSLRPEAVACLVFWTRNPRPLEPHLDEIDSGYASYFHYTITGLPAVFEPRVPPVAEAVETFRALADRYGPERVMWRYDPILISALTPPEYHIEMFAALARQLSGRTRRVYISFVHYYARVAARLAALDVAGRDPSPDEKTSLARRLAGIAAEHGMTLHGCCSPELAAAGVQPAHCVDAPLIARLFPGRLEHVPLRPTRAGCGCFASRDIGAYNTCGHACVYCYANSDRPAGRSDPQSAELCPLVGAASDG